MKTRLPTRIVLALALGVVATHAAAQGAAQQDEPEVAREADPQPEAGAARARRPAPAPEARPTDEPLVRVYRSTEPAQNTRDARVRYGNTAISRPMSAPAGPRASVRRDGAILVPDNATGPGIPWHHVSDVLAAERREAQAEALLAERLAAAPFVQEVEEGEYFYSPVYHRAHRGWAGWGARGVHSFPRGADGPDQEEPTVRRRIIRFDDVHGRAQTRFSEAARPPVDRVNDPHADVQRRFGDQTRPPLDGPQRDRDEAQRRVNRSNVPDPSSTTDR